MLRAPDERPRCRAAQYRYELTPFQLNELHPLPITRLTA
jgi:hypothetical protein